MFGLFDVEPFRAITGPAVALLEDNVDTDIIFPARFLLITARDGLGAYAFHDRAGAAALLRRRAGVLVAGANFGCGSSREQAVWALSDCGIRAIVAPSFGEIFAANCLRNGILPVTLAEETVARFAEQAAAGDGFTVDLDAETIVAGADAPVAFRTPAAQRLALLNGWDETDLILDGHGAGIKAFEARQRRAQPWLYGATR